MAKRPPSLTTRPATGARKAWASTKGSRQSRGYGWSWDKARAAVLKLERFCRVCRAADRYTIATDVDHILSKRRGGTDDPANLQPLCGPCHKAKTAIEARALRD